jgi:hypothetical protein
MLAPPTRTPRCDTCSRPGRCPDPLPAEAGSSSPAGAPLNHSGAIRPQPSPSDSQKGWNAWPRTRERQQWRNATARTPSANDDYKSRPRRTRGSRRRLIAGVVRSTRPPAKAPSYRPRSTPSAARPNRLKSRCERRRRRGARPGLMGWAQAPSARCSRRDRGGSRYADTSARVRFSVRLCLARLLFEDGREAVRYRGPRSGLVAYRRRRT